MQINNEYICKLLQHNDSRGVELLYNKYYRPMVLWANNFIKDLHTSEDLVQEFFVTFWEKESYRRLTSSNLSAYLFSSVKFTSIKYLEKRDPLRKSFEVSNYIIEFIEIDNLTEEILLQIESEIKKLPPRTREVLEAVYIDGMRYKEVAVKLSISVETVKTLLSNALKRLRIIFSNVKALFS